MATQYRRRFDGAWSAYDMLVAGQWEEVARFRYAAHDIVFSDAMKNLGFVVHTAEG